MRPEILHLPPASLRSFPRFLSFALLLSLSPVFRYQLFVFPLYVHSTRRSYHLKPNLDPKARREEIPAGISLVSPSFPPHGFPFPRPFSLRCIRNWNRLGREINASINRRGKRDVFAFLKLNIQRIRVYISRTRVQFVRDLFAFTFPRDGSHLALYKIFIRSCARNVLDIQRSDAVIKRTFLHRTPPRFFFFPLPEINLDDANKKIINT